MAGLHRLCTRHPDIAARVIRSLGPTAPGDALFRAGGAGITQEAVPFGPAAAVCPPSPAPRAAQPTALCRRRPRP